MDDRGMAMMTKEIRVYDLAQSLGAEKRQGMGCVGTINFKVGDDSGPMMLQRI